MRSPVAILLVALALCAFVLLGFLGFATSLGAAEASLLALVLLAVLVNFGLIVAAVVHALTRDDLTSIQRLVWILIAVLVTPVVSLGAIVYFALGRERTRALFRDVGQAPPAPPSL